MDLTSRPHDGTDRGSKRRQDASGNDASSSRDATGLRLSLECPESPSDVLRVLHGDFGLTRAELARAASTTTVTVGRWLDGETEARRSEGIDALRAVVVALLRQGRMSPKAIHYWLGARDVDLGEDALSAIGHGRVDDVLAAGLSLAQVR